MFGKTINFSFIIVLFTCFSSAYPQSTTGTLKGRIINKQGNAIVEANISVYGDYIQGVRGAVSDEKGYFRVLALPVGMVTVTLSHIAYHQIVFENIKIDLGKTTPLGEIQFTSKTLELPDVVVAGAKPVIDLNTTVVAANISAREFESLPTERNYLTITSLLPQANTSFLGDDVNISGSTGQENAYFIDGMNTTEMYRATGSTNLPYNFIKEIEVKSGGYEAEYGRATGGIVNVITHTGTNKFEAKAFGFFTDNRFAEDRRRGFVELNTGDFSRYDAGFTLGGPILKDRLWFFAALNRRIEQEEVTFDGLGVRADKTTINTFAGKLTWQPQPNTNVMFTVFGDPTDRDRIATNATPPFNPVSLANPDPFLGKFEQGGINFSLRGNHLFSSNLQIETAVSRHTSKLVANAATELGRIEPLFIDNTTGVWSGGYGEEFDRRATRYAASLAGAYYLNEHKFKAGIEYEYNKHEDVWINDSDQPPGIGTILKNAENAFLTLPWNVDIAVRNQIISLFGQGSIAVHPRLRINAGLRWDGQYLKGLDTGFTQNLLAQYQPRIGLVFCPGEIGSQKITGSYGRFYEQIPARAFNLDIGGLFQEAFFFDHNPLDDPTGGVLRFETDPSQTGIDPDLRGEHFDEFTLGYERTLTHQYKLGIRGIYRAIREIIQNADDPDDPVTGAQAITGNPGRGLLDFLPEPKREYTALELTFEKVNGNHLRFLASYVLSRTYGNYTGLYSSDSGLDLPNAGTQYDDPIQLENATGLLPNDRTHVFKFNGAYNFDSGLTLGTFFSWQSGTPLNEIGAHPLKPFGYTFLRKRGTVGRTPAIMDLNFRLSYDLNRILKTQFNQKLILDVFHLFSQREPVNFEQRRFFAYDAQSGEQISENVNYLEPLLYQPPMTIRLGLEVGF